jgi:hypothetical protein
MGQKPLHQYLVEIRKRDIPEIREEMIIEGRGIIPYLTGTHTRFHPFPPFLEIIAESNFLWANFNDPALDRGEEVFLAAIRESLSEHKGSIIDLRQNQIQLLSYNDLVG